MLDARHADMLAEAERAIRPRLAPDASLVAMAGDVADAAHRRALVVAAAAPRVVSTSSSTTPARWAPPRCPTWRPIPSTELTRVLEVNVVAPLALVQEALALLRRSARPAVLNITSDASVEAYEGWGGYGLSKAALDHMSAVLAVEEPSLLVWAVDPGDMRTQMHQDAFPGEDISDRPLPAEVVRRPRRRSSRRGSRAGGTACRTWRPAPLPSVESEAS